MSFYPEDMQNISKLRGLRSADSRRRIGSTFSPIEEEADLDLYNTAQPQPQVNTPIASAAGGVAPESYDVRANQILDPVMEQAQAAQAQMAPPQEAAPPPEQKSFWNKLGEAIHRLNPLDPREAPEQRNPTDIWNAESATATPPPGFGQKLMDVVNGVNSPARQLHAQEVADEQDAKEIRNVLFNRELENAQANPWETSTYGNVDRFANSPELQEKFFQVTNQPWNQEIAAKEKEYESIMQSIELKYDAIDQTLSADQQRLKDRILNGGATDADKYYIGLALLLPAIVGGTFGAEAGLGALGGGLKNLSGMYEKRDENARADEEAYREISKDRAVLGLKKGELALEGAKLPGQLRKDNPNPNEDIEGAKGIEYTNPETGETVAGGIEVLPGLVADPKYANSPKKREKMYEQAERINREDRPALNRANQATAEIAAIIPQIQDSKLFGKMVAAALASEKKDTLQKLYKATAPDILVNGRKENLAVFLDRKIEMMKDSYRKNHKMRALTTSVADHMENIVSNPLYSGLTADDLLSSLLDLRNRAQENYADEVHGLGFLAEPALNEFGKENRALFSFLNENERQKLNKSFKQKIRKPE